MSASGRLVVGGLESVGWPVGVTGAAGRLVWGGGEALTEIATAHGRTLEAGRLLGELPAAMP